jgi:hypothetical protein
VSSKSEQHAAFTEARPVAIGRQPVRSRRSLEQFLAFLERPSARRTIVLAALVFAAPALFAGFAADDYVLSYEFHHPHGEWAGSAPFDLFRLIDPPHTLQLRDGAGFAWWTYPQTRLSYLRPLTSLTHALDFALWPTLPIAMHLHSLVWFAGLLVLVAVAYGELIENRWVRGLAFAMFALDSAKAIPIGWISNRNALVAGVFGVATLYFHHRARGAGARRFAALAWLAFGATLFSAELGLGVVGYLLSYAVFLDRASLRQRVVSLAPYALVGATWLVARERGQYGVLNYIGYWDPTREPLQFLQSLLPRLIVLLTSQVTRFGADLYEIVPSGSRLIALLPVAVLFALTLWFTWPSLREQRLCRFFAAGALVSLVPATAGAAADRLLMFAGFGVMPVLAQAIHGALARGHVWRRRTAAALTFLHLAIEPFLLALLVLMPFYISNMVKSSDATLSRDPALSAKNVFVAYVPNSELLTFLPTTRAYFDQPRPRRLYWLMAHPQPGMLERPSSNLLRLHVPSGLFKWEERPDWLPMQPGERVKLSEMTVTVREVAPDGTPTLCDFEFAKPPDSAEFLWLTWRDGRLEPFALPAVGHSASVAP